MRCRSLTEEFVYRNLGDCSIAVKTMCVLVSTAVHINTELILLQKSEYGVQIAVLIAID